MRVKRFGALEIIEENFVETLQKRRSGLKRISTEQLQQLHEQPFRRFTFTFTMANQQLQLGHTQRGRVQP